MGYLKKLVKSFQEQLIYAKILNKKSDFIHKNYSNNYIEKKDIIKKLDDCDIIDFLKDNDIELYVFLCTNYKFIVDYSLNGTFSLSKSYQNYINNNLGCEKIADIFKNISMEQLKHPLFLFKKGDSIIYVTGTHGNRCDHLFLDNKYNQGRILKERISIETGVENELKLGIPYYHTQKNNSVIYNFIQNKNLFVSYKLDENFNINDVTNSYHRTVLESWLNKYYINDFFFLMEN